MQAPLNETAYLAFSEQKRKKVNKKKTLGTNTKQAVSFFVYMIVQKN